MRLLAAAALSGLLAGPASAQKLKAFESELTKGSPASSASGPSASSDAQGDSFLVDLFDETVVAGLGMSAQYMESRRRGDPVLPVFRLDGGYQRIVGDIDAGSMRAEAGWGPIGLDYEYVKMREHDPPDRLTSNAFELLLRTFGTRGFRLDWAAGYRSYTRGERHGGAQAGFSLGIYPWRAGGFEGDFRWGSIANATISDYRARVSVRPFPAPFAFNAGYRVMRAGDATLHGPEAGVSWVW